MKKVLCTAAVIGLAMMLMPLFVLNSEQLSAALPAAAKTSVPAADTEDFFRIYDKETGKISRLSAGEYIAGVVAAEVPVSYEEEALKAQAVAAYTFAAYKRNQATDKEYDLSTDCNTDQSFADTAALREKWGENYEAYREKINKAVSAVAGKMVTYQNQPILAVYHAVSPGSTESAETVWGSEIPYLLEVSCESDVLSEHYSQEKSFTRAEAEKILAEKFQIASFDDTLFTDIKTSESGFLESVTVSGKKLTGSELREIFSLVSCHIEIKEADGKIVFTTLGRGHAVGMSQNAANELAKEGLGYDEILLYFYKNCKISG